MTRATAACGPGTDDAGRGGGTNRAGNLRIRLSLAFSFDTGSLDPPISPAGIFHQ
jgi:hypothetical protein